MKISQKSTAKEIKVSENCKALEYSVMDQKIHGSLIKLSGRYPDSGYTRNEVCTELVYVLSGSGKLIGRETELSFSEGDQLVIEPGEDFAWEANAELFMPCTPAWYPEQHKQII